MPEVYVGYRQEGTGEPRVPNKRQAEAHDSVADVLMLGGAAGGGKSEFDVVDSVQFCLRHKGVQTAIFRRQSVQLQQSIVPRILIHIAELERFGLARYQDTKSRVLFPKNNAYLWLLHCEREADVYRYQSAQWHRLYVDEASHMTGYQLTYLGSRVRSNIPGVIPRQRYSTNPGNVGHAFLYETFIEPEPWEWRTLGRPPRPGELWTPDIDPEKALAIKSLPAHLAKRLLERPMTRQFIPARLWDNDALMESDPMYAWRLMQLPEDERRMLLEGDWSVWKGQMFGEFRKVHVVCDADPVLLDSGYTLGQTIPWHVLPVSGWSPGAIPHIYGSVDYGYANPWAFYLHATMPDGRIVTFREVYRAGLRDEEQAKLIRGMLERDVGELKRYTMPQHLVCDPSMWQSRKEQGLAESIAEVYERILGPLGVWLKPGTSSPGSRVAGVQRVKQALSTAPDGLPWWQITEDCPVLVKQLPALPRDEDNPEDVDSDAEDHGYDSARYFLQSRPAFPRLAAEDPLRHLDADPISKAHQAARLKLEQRKVQPLHVRGLTGR